jgi:hypothetical protein
MKRIMFTASWKGRILLISSVFHLIRARGNLQLLQGVEDVEDATDDKAKRLCGIIAQ